MGFEQEQSRATFMGIFAGKLTIRAKEGDEGAVMRENKNGVKVWEFHYPKFTGTLLNVECTKHEKMGYQYVISLDDVGTTYKLSISVESKYGDNFICKLLSLKKGDILTLAPYDFEKDGRKNVGISIVRDGEKIPALITKETPNGRPQPEGDRMDEEDYKVYMIKVRKFYRSVVDKWQESFVAKQPTKQPEKQVEAKNSFDDSQDLPF
jgi:hypothetical protein